MLGLQPLMRLPTYSPMYAPEENLRLSQQAQAIAILRRPDITAHVWLPGANGVNVASLPSNNYLLSDGSTGYSTVDGVVGLGLDGMGSASTVASGTTLAAAPWGTPTGGSIVADVWTPAAQFNNIPLAYTFVFGRTYRIRGTAANLVGNYAFYSGVGAAYGSVGATFNFVFTASNAITVLQANSVPTSTIAIPTFVLEEVTGTHLTQATTANKPLVRRGMFNELLNSATPATQSVTCIAAPYTLALIGTGNVVLSGTGAGTLTGTGASDLVVLNFTPTAGSVTFTKAGTVSSFGLFKGTWTAAQILAEGGIPTTTATAASNPSAGKYWWSLDGSNDSLLSGNLGITNACTIVIAGRVNSLAAMQVLMQEGVGGLRLYIFTNGAVGLDNPTAVGTLVATGAGVITAGVPFVVTARLSAGTAVIRNLGVQVATAATPIVGASTTGSRIGTDFAGTSFPTNGAIGWVVPLPVALSDADCLTVERLVSSQFPNGPVF